ncbi:DUF5677 domain-containing protein [Lactococcus petauri]|uniref:DUF5677 domain-containing protein n=1 Tax=Lactococcus petauri TaxID=1940789 RepID=UPI0038541368
MTNINIPTYSELYELTKRKLKGLRKIAQNRDNFGMGDELLLVLLGNMNQRLNTMFFLIQSDISDGVYPLQRTFFEMQVAYQAIMKSDNKDIFFKFYLEKNEFETANKVNRFISDNESTIQNTIEPWEKKYISSSRDAANETLKKSNKYVNMKGNKQFKLWFELASNKSLLELSEEFWDSYRYYLCYDEPSNWVHTQRLEMNMNVDNFSMAMQTNYYQFMLNALLHDSNFLLEAMNDFKEYIQIKDSKQFDIYNCKLVLFIKNLKIALEELSKNSYDAEEANKTKEETKDWFNKKEIL